MPGTDGLSPRDRVVRDVVRGLYDGRYEPGQRLTEAQLTTRYGISRGPVREALNRLAAAGVVDLEPGRGAQVRVLKLGEAIDMLVIVEALIRVAARLAAERIEAPGATDRLKAAVARLASTDPLADAAAYALARDGFYGTLTAIASNAELSRILPTVQVHLIRVQFRSILRSADEGRQADYERIADAVLAGRGVAAETSVRQHLSRAIEAMRRHMS